MRIVKALLASVLVMPIIMISGDQASAGLRRARAKAEETPAKAAAETSVYENNQQNGTTVGQSAQQRWDNASPNEKQTTKNLAVVDHEKKETNEATAEAAAKEHASTDSAATKKRPRLRR